MLFQTRYPELRGRNVLIIDDEADLASISGRRANGVSMAGIISRQIDQLRDLVTNSSFLQVTATPYALYLQPDDEIIINGNSLFKPKRPAFTVLLPNHEKYVGATNISISAGLRIRPAFFFLRRFRSPNAMH